MAAVHPFNAQDDGGDAQPLALGYGNQYGGGYNPGQGGGAGVPPYGYGAPVPAGYAAPVQIGYAAPVQAGYAASYNAIYPVEAIHGYYYPPPGGNQSPPDQQQQQQQKPVDPRNDILKGRWAVDLCSCCTDCVPNFLMAWCCPAVSLAQVYARLGISRYLPTLVCLAVLYLIGVIGDLIPSGSTEAATYTYDPDTGYIVASVPPPPAAMLLLPITVGISQTLFRLVVWQARAKVRERFAIPGSCLGDCCASCVCSCCAIAQLATHVKSYTPGSCSFGGPDVLPAFQ